MLRIGEKMTEDHIGVGREWLMPIVLSKAMIQME
jgi:hypothetical protein